MHRRRASESLHVKIPDVMEKGKWMFNLRNQSSHEELHISKCQSLLNQDIKWLGDQKWKLIIWLKYSKSQTLKVNAKARTHMTTLIKAKRNEVATINIVQAQVEEMYFICNLECRHAALSRGMPHGLLTKFQCSTKPKYSSEISETQWPHTLHISLN
jgi:hypothetical protein